MNSEVAKDVVAKSFERLIPWKAIEEIEGVGSAGLQGGNSLPKRIYIAGVTNFHTIGCSGSNEVDPTASSFATE